MGSSVFPVPSSRRHVQSRDASWSKFTPAGAATAETSEMRLECAGVEAPGSRADTGVAELVVRLAFLRVAQDFVGLADLLETIRGIG